MNARAAPVLVQRPAEAADVVAHGRRVDEPDLADARRARELLRAHDVRQLGAQGAGVLSTPISDVMTRAVQTCTMGDDALAILERMTQGRFRHMPVVDPDGNMLGVVSIGDAVSGRLKELAAEKEALTGMIMGA